MDQILIDGHAYRLISSVKLSRTNTLPKHTLEDGVQITDHIKIGAPTLEISLLLFPGEYQTLETLSRRQRLFPIVIPQGSYTNVALQKLSDEYGKTANTTQCTITLAVQTITRTSRLPKTLDGISTGITDTAGITTNPAAECPDDPTVEQLKKYYLNHLPPSEFTTENARLDGMPTKELWDYLVTIQEYLELTDQIAAIANETTDTTPRLIIQHKIDGKLGDTTSKFTFNDTTYRITSRKDEGTLIHIALRGDTDFTYIHHATVTRSRDNAVVYNGTIHDLTPFELIDPETGIALATLEYSSFYQRLYIA